MSTGIGTVRAQMWRKVLFVLTIIFLSFFIMDVIHFSR